MKRSPIALLATILLVVSMVLMGGIGTTVAQTVVATIVVNDGPSAVGVNSVTNRVYVANSDSDNVSVIDGATNKKITDIAVNDCPIGVGVNSVTNRVYVANLDSNNVSVIDGATNKKITDIAVGFGPYKGVGVNSVTNRVYVSTLFSTNVSVIDGATNTKITDIAVNAGALGIGVNPKTNRVYVANGGSSNVLVIDGATNTKITDIAVNEVPTCVGVNSVTNRVYVTNGGSNNVSVIDGATDKMITDIAVNNSPHGVGVNSVTNRVYVANGGSDNVSVIDGATNKKITDIAVNDNPWGVGVNPQTAMIYVANRNSDNVSVIHDPSTVSSTWYLAEGSTAWGFSCAIAIENPNPTDVTLQLTFMTETGPIKPTPLVLAGESQGFINPADVLGQADFSTLVECVEGKTIAVDRTMSWTGEGAPCPDGHCSIGVTAPNNTWYLAEGSSAWGFECWLLIQNPNATEATAEVTYMIEGTGPQTFEKKIPANSRRTYNMADDIGQKDASIKVDANKPVIAERAMYRNNKREGHDSIGTTSPANDFYLAEGTTAWGFTTYILVQNPNPSPTDVTITYMATGGPITDPTFTMEANSRKTIRVNDIHPDMDFSTRVHGSGPIIAERAMYWGEGTPLGEACHGSIGLSAPHTSFYLPCGQTGGDAGYETWTLVQNLNDTDVTVEISYLTNVAGSIPNVVFEESIPANSRRSFSMGDRIPVGSASVMVKSLTQGKQIMVERAMYWNSRGSGTDTIGGFSD